MQIFRNEATVLVNHQLYSNGSNSHKTGLEISWITVLLSVNILYIKVS